MAQEPLQYLNERLEIVNKKLNGILSDNFLILETSSQNVTKEYKEFNDIQARFDKFAKQLEVYLKSRIFDQKQVNDAEVAKKNINELIQNYNNTIVL